MIAYFARHPTAANLMMLAMLVLGITALSDLKRETFPEIPPDEIQISLNYLGASAGQVEEGVCRRIEDALENVDEVDERRCEAREGIAVATVVMREGGDFDRLLANVKTEVETIDDFPADVGTPIVRQLGTSDFVASIAITGPMSARDLKAYAENLKDRLGRTEGISEIAVKGFSDNQIRIEVSALTLRQLGLSAADIANIVGRQSLQRPLGTIENDQRELLLRFDDERRTTRSFADLVVVGGDTGAEVRLGDIAHITDRFEQAEERILFNGQRAAMLEVKKARDADTLRIIGAMREFVQAELRRAPSGVALEITQDVSSIVSDRLKMLIGNGVQGLLLVVLTLTLFFSLRYALWVALGLPVAFAGTFVGMVWLGLSIDMLTMVGLLIAIGILVDDAIVIAENIAAHHARGVPPLEAAVTGVREVAPGVLASFATTVMIFGPLAFLKGDIGAILKVMPMVLILTLSVSLIEAFLILPSHLHHSLRHGAGRPPGWLREHLDAGVDWCRDHVVGRLTDTAIAWRYLTLGLTVLMLLGSMAVVAGGLVKFQAFPDLDGDVIEARILLPQGTPLARTQAVVDRVVGGLRRVDEALSSGKPGAPALVRNINIQFNKNIDAFETGPHVATVSVDLLTADDRGTRLDDILQRWREEVGVMPDVLALKFTDFSVGPGGKAIDIRLEGENLEQLGQAARELTGWLAAYRGMADLNFDLRPGKPEIRLSTREGALGLGLDAEIISSQLRAAYFGRTAAEFQSGRETYEVDVRLAPDDRDSVADLSDFTVTTADGSQVPLGSIARLQRDRGFARINRIDGRRTVTVQGELDTTQGNAQEILGDTAARFLPQLTERYPGVSVSFEGQAKDAAKTSSSIRSGFLFGMLGVYILLAVMFRSYVQPLAVLVAIPTGLVGAIWGHVIMGLDLSMPSIMGFVSLSGIVVNNAILLVDFTERGIAAGDSLNAAAGKASRRRFRPILLTSLTTIIGLLPLLFETSVQAQILIPLITSLTFGLAVSAASVLFLVPAVFAIIADFQTQPATVAAET